MLLALITILEIITAIENVLHIGNEVLLVNVTSGPVLGSLMTSEDGRDFYAYRGIPYAESPTQQLKFEPPVAKGKWNGTWDATTDGPQCAQFNYMTRKIIEEDDCLRLNVYTPLSRFNRTDNNLLPVIFYIHGGALVLGSGVSAEVGPQKLMDYDVVVVTINYRLGAFGFLSTKDDVLPGNYGLLDQVEALKWVRDNIKEFGGDPNKVTISGTSAGSWSVMLHMVSPLSKGLFHGAIAQSGSPFGKWGNTFDSKKNFERLTSKLDCEDENEKIAVDCLRNRPNADIITINNGPQEFTNMISKIRYHAENDSVRGSEAFLPDHPSSLLKEGTTVNKVPLFIGVTNDEGAFIFDALLHFYNSTGIDFLNNIFTTVLQDIFGLNEEESKNLQQAIIKEYFSDDPKDEDEINYRLSKIFGDITFDAMVDRDIQKLSSLGLPVYAYRFTHAKGIVVDFLGFNKTLTYKKKGEVNHGEDFTYVFDAIETPETAKWFQLNDKDKRVSRILLELWTSFAKDLVPSSKTMNTTWTPSTPTNPAYLNISSQPFMVDGHLSNHTEFWENYN